MRGEKLLKHPDKGEIDEMLLKGYSLQVVIAAINPKYKRKEKKHLHLTQHTLFEYRKNFLNLSGDNLLDVRKNAAREGRVIRKNAANKEDEKTSLQAPEPGITLPAKLGTDGDDELLDLNKTIRFIAKKVKDRIILLEGQKVSHLNDKVINDYLTNLRGTLSDYYRIIDTAENKKTEVNITINQIQNYASLLKGAIQDTLLTMDPDLVPVFLGKLQERVNELAEDEQDLVNVFQQKNNWGKNSGRSKSKEDFEVAEVEEEDTAEPVFEAEDLEL